MTEAVATADIFPRRRLTAHSGGMPRQINTLCSRLLLFGFMEELHTLAATVVETVANDLSREMAVVTLDHASEASRAEPNGRSEAVSELIKRVSALEESVIQRVSALEESVSRHDRVIQQAADIATAFLRSSGRER